MLEHMELLPEYMKQIKAEAFREGYMLAREEMARDFVVMVAGLSFARDEANVLLDRLRVKLLAMPVKERVE